MRRFSYRRKSFYINIVIVLVLFVGLGYALFFEKLTINNTVNYNAMSFQVGFSSAEDNGGAIEAQTKISDDGKTITVLCDFGQSISQKDCIAKATITNSGNINIGLASEPLITYDDTYIHSVTFKWADHPTFLNTIIHQNGFIEHGKSEEVIITIKSKNIDKNNSPKTGISVPITINMNYKEYNEKTLPKTEDLAILPSMGCYSVGDVLNEDMTIECTNKNPEELEYNAAVKKLSIERGINIPQEAIDNNMVLYLTESKNIVVYGLINEEYSNEDEQFIDVYIQSDSQLYAPEDMAYYFAYMINLEEINGLELLDTSMTTNMEGMFLGLGAINTYTNFDLSSLDTSKVTNMKLMLAGAGAVSQKTKIDLTSIDTSSATDMSYMFAAVGVGEDISLADTLNYIESANVIATYNEIINETPPEESTELILDISNFDTSNVINMKGMFAYTGAGMKKFELNVSNFNTSNVKDMTFMFCFAAVTNPEFTIDVSRFDTTNLEDMSAMFALFAVNSTKLKTSITIRNPNVICAVETFWAFFLDGTELRINYTIETEELVDQMIKDIREDADVNVYKGSLTH